MAIDRSKFKASTASQLVQADKDLNKGLGKKDKQGKGHDIDEGNNLFRIYPAHPDSVSQLFVVPFAEVYLPAMVQERDKDGKPVLENGQPKMKLGVKPVYNAVVHGNKPKDLIVEYINLMNKKAKSLNLDKDGYKKFMLPVYGAFNNANPKASVQGMNYKAQHILYADKYPAANPAAKPIFDELRIGAGIKKRLNALSALESANDPMGTDPFSDIEDGRAIRILKQKSDDPNLIYTTELDSSTENQVINGKTYKVNKTYPLSDEQLEKLMQQEPLDVKYGKKLATRKNFETQLAGLEIIDNKYNLGIFGSDEWNEIVLECDEYYPETDAVETSTKTAYTSTDEDNAPEIINSDEFDLLDRKELQTYARDNKTGIIVKPTMTDDVIREALRTWKKNYTIPHVALPTDEDYQEEETEEVEPVTKPVVIQKEQDTFLADMNAANPSTETLSAKDKLAAMRARKGVAA
jgi:hypothetical protein